MRKTDKKLDKKIRKALTNVCEMLLKEIDGFEWLTHLVDYKKFPSSLKIVCVFRCEVSLKNFLSTSNRDELTELVRKEFMLVDINLKNLSSHIKYDT